MVVPLPCFFPSCFGDEDDDRRQKKHGNDVIIKIDTSSGAMRLPSYKKVRREASKMLQYSWEKKWGALEMRCISSPHEAFHLTENSGRTPLHLSTFNVPCPLRVARALLLANRHMVVIQDNDWYTPLHNVCYFRHGDPLISIFCDTILMVQCELQGQGTLPSPSGMSPLYLASKRAAPLTTLRTLLNTRPAVNWIAPSTGGEPYNDHETLDEYSSPLEILLRDRSASCFEPIRTGCFDSKIHAMFRGVAHSKLSKRSARREAPSSIEENKTLVADGLSDCEFDAILVWEKCLELLHEHCPLLKSIYTQKDGSEVDFAVVHSIASLKVPVPALLEIALILFPEQATMRDRQGMIPLHHVLLAKHPYATNALISHLLRCAPSSVDIPFPNGGSVLSQALCLELPPTIVYTLLHSGSHASLTKPYDGLLPCCIAGLSGYDLDMIFDLVLASPEVVR